MNFTDKKLFLAPMAGITDSVFRQICRANGADCTVSEMVSAEGLFYKSKNTADLLYFKECERPLGIQLFGSDPEHLALATRFVSENIRPDFIDLNSGCPVAKVAGKNGGASLLKDRALFEQILHAMVNATTIPVTVKIRSGWNKFEWVDKDFAKTAEQCGVAAITLHPRSQTMMFTGHSFWDRIAAVKQAVSIPVIGNGDITTAGEALQMLSETGCDSIMIGRGTYGNPWIFSQIKDALDRKEVKELTYRDKLPLAVEHLRLFKEQYGELRASKEMKKHLSWYVKGIPDATQIRNQIFRTESYSLLLETMEKLLSEAVLTESTN